MQLLPHVIRAAAAIALACVLGLSFLEPAAAALCLLIGPIGALIPRGPARRVGLVLLASVQPLLWPTLFFWLIYLNTEALKAVRDVAMITGGPEFQSLAFNPATPVIGCAYALAIGMAVAIVLIRRYRLPRLLVGMSFGVAVLCAFAALGVLRDTLISTETMARTNPMFALLARLQPLVTRATRGGLGLEAVHVPYRATARIDDDFEHASLEEDMSFEPLVVEQLNRYWPDTYDMPFAEWLEGATRPRGDEEEDRRVSLRYSGTTLVLHRETRYWTSCKRAGALQAVPFPQLSAWPAPLGACIPTFSILQGATNIVPDRGSILVVDAPAQRVASTFPEAEEIQHVNNRERFVIPVGYPRSGTALKSLVNVFNDQSLINIYLAGETFRGQRQLWLLRTISGFWGRWALALGAAALAAVVTTRRLAHEAT